MLVEHLHERTEKTRAQTRGRVARFARRRIQGFGAQAKRNRPGRVDLPVILNKDGGALDDAAVAIAPVICGMVIAGAVAARAVFAITRLVARAARRIPADHHLMSSHWRCPVFARAMRASLAQPHRHQVERAAHARHAGEREFGTAVAGVAARLKLHFGAGGQRSLPVQAPLHKGGTRRQREDAVRDCAWRQREGFPVFALGRTPVNTEQSVRRHLGAVVQRPVQARRDAGGVHNI